MEFLTESEVQQPLREHGVIAAPADEARVYLQMEARPDAVRVHLHAPDAEVEPHEGAKLVKVGLDQLPEAVELIIHKLHLDQLLLMPVGKWRDLFDTVAFDLAENEEWQAVDTAATVELNTRDPLLCEPGDFHTVCALLKALLHNAETPEQGLMLTTTTAPLLMEVVPGGAIRVCIGNEVMADEVVGALA